MAKDMSLVRKFVVQHFGRHVKPVAATLTAMGLALVGLGVYSGTTPAAASSVSRGAGSLEDVWWPSYGGTTIQAWFGYYSIVADNGVTYQAICIDPDKKFGTSYTPAPLTPGTAGLNATQIAQIESILNNPGSASAMAVSLAVRAIANPGILSTVEVDNTGTGSWELLQTPASPSAGGATYNLTGFTFDPNMTQTPNSAGVIGMAGLLDGTIVSQAKALIAGASTTMPTGWDGNAPAKSNNIPANNILPAGQNLQVTYTYDSSMPNGTPFTMTINGSAGTSYQVHATSNGGVVTFSWPVVADGSQTFSWSMASDSNIPMGPMYLPGNGGQNMMIASTSQGDSEPGQTFRTDFQPIVTSVMNADFSDTANVSIQGVNGWLTKADGSGYGVDFKAEMVGPITGKVTPVPGGVGDSALSTVQSALSGLPVICTVPFTVNSAGTQSQSLSCPGFDASTAKAGTYGWVIWADKSQQSDADTKAAMQDSYTSGLFITGLDGTKGWDGNAGTQTVTDENETRFVPMKFTLSSQIKVGSDGYQEISQGGSPIDTITLHSTNGWITDPATGNAITVNLHGSLYGNVSLPWKTTTPTTVGTAPAGSTLLYQTDAPGVPITLPTSGNADASVTTTAAQAKTVDHSTYYNWVWDVRDADNTTPVTGVPGVATVADFWAGQPADAYGQPDETGVAQLNLKVTSTVPTDGKFADNGSQFQDKGSNPTDTVTVSLAQASDLWVTDFNGDPLTLTLQGDYYDCGSSPCTPSATAPGVTDKSFIGTAFQTVTLPASGNTPMVTDTVTAPFTVPNSAYGVWVWHIVKANQTTAVQPYLEGDFTDSYGQTNETIATRMDLTISSDMSDAASTANGEQGGRDGANGPGEFQNQKAAPYDTVTLCLADPADVWLTNPDGKATTVHIDGDFYAASASSWYQANALPNTPALPGATANIPTDATKLASSAGFDVTLPTSGSDCATFPAPAMPVTVPYSTYGQWVWRIDDTVPPQTAMTHDLLQRSVSDQWGQENETIVTKMQFTTHSQAVDPVQIIGDAPVKGDDGIYTANVMQVQKKTNTCTPDETAAGCLPNDTYVPTERDNVQVWQDSSGNWYADATPDSRTVEPGAGESEYLLRHNTGYGFVGSTRRRSHVAGLICLTVQSDTIGTRWQTQMDTSGKS